MGKKYLTAIFMLLTAVVLLITVYRSFSDTAVDESDAAMVADGEVDANAEIGNKIPDDALVEVASEINADGMVELEDTALEDGNFSEIQTSVSDVESDSDPWEETKRVALTFDDGPHPVYTVKLLDGLAERGVHATFFVIGENIPGNEDIIARMDEEGHLIGNHTYDHVKITDLSVEEACAQVEKTSELVRAITGKDTEYVHPPFGSWRKDLECSFEMIPVLWTVDPLDWTTKNTSDIVRHVLEDVEPDGIILLHDYYESSVDAALQIVDALAEEEYEFVTVDELILE